MIRVVIGTIAVLAGFAVVECSDVGAVKVPYFDAYASLWPRR